MPDETVTIRYEADTTRYAAGARRVSQDLDKIAAKAARAEASAARATRSERRRGIAGAARVAGAGGISDFVGGVGANPAISGGLIAAYGVKAMVDAAREADPEMAKLGESIAKTVGPTARVNETLIRLGNAMSTLANIGKNVFGTVLSGIITTLTAAAGTLASVWGRVAQMVGLKQFGTRLSGAGEDLLGQAYADITGGSGRGGVIEMEKKLEEAKARRKARDQAAREAARGQGSNRISEGFQGSAGLYVTSGAAMMANQTLAIQRSMLRELQSLTRATDRVRDTIRDTAYTS